MKPVSTDFKSPIIKCPHCGAEYLAGEIYLPGDFIGKPDNVIKDALGKILYVDYRKDEEPEFTSTFECEYCNKQFVTVTQLCCKSSVQSEELDFNNPIVSLLD